MGEVVYYDTRSEIGFLARLGEWCEEGEVRSRHHRLSKLDLLEGYIRTIPHRHRWGNINKEHITDFAVGLLEELRDNLENGKRGRTKLEPKAKEVDPLGVDSTGTESGDYAYDTKEVCGETFGGVD